MERFAKLFETETTQVLFVLTNADNGAPRIEQTCHLMFGLVAVATEGNDDTDECWKTFRDAFAALDQNEAGSFVERMRTQYSELIAAYESPEIEF
jgi:hypothetical protein